MAGEKKLKHIAIIMDGNGRWAKKKGFTRIKGHITGSRNVKKVVTGCIKNKIKYLTLYAFSTENWARPEKEINALMNLLLKFINNEKKDMHRNKIRLIVSGDLTRLNKNLQGAIKDVINLTKNNRRITVNVALNYGSREEILMAVKNIVSGCKKNRIKLNQINEQLFKKNLYYGDILPYPDLLIRTSGEQRISNFLLWQIAYSELYFTETFWPDFNEKKLQKAIDHYYRRERRFGGL